MTTLRHHSFAREIPAEEALDWFQESDFEDSPPYFLTHWKTHKKFFYALGGLIAYEETPGELVIAGEPLISAGAGRREDLLEVFCEMATRKKKGVCGYYVGDDWQVGPFSKVALGASSFVRFDNFNLSGAKYKEVRRALRKGDQRNLTVVSVDKNSLFGQNRVDVLYKEWKSQKSRVDIQFLLSKPHGESLVGDYEEWFAVEKDGEYLAFCGLLPYMKDGRLCFYLDHILHHPKKEPHALSYLISFLMENFWEQGICELNLGLCPFVKSKGKSGQWIEKAFGLLFHMPMVYRAKGLYAFKKKFGGEEKPEYCFFNQKENRLKQLTEMAGVTFRWS